MKTQHVAVALMDVVLKHSYSWTVFVFLLGEIPVEFFSIEPSLMVFVICTVWQTQDAELHW